MSWVSDFRCILLVIPRRVIRFALILTAWIFQRRFQKSPVRFRYHFTDVNIAQQIVNKRARITEKCAKITSDIPQLPPIPPVLIKHCPNTDRNDFMPKKVRCRLIAEERGEEIGGK